ncbi:hypothetical protein [Acidovorax sp. Root217]|uniref:hypothetical protein n=1 Tax=Acidovorax sp. Root217 TaxID=1736492 RepID=UPI000709EA1A|nr:hypothetical protein [Acidovorax sp. Root217]KRC26936.1 hypothetical protein ASE31_15935 [Acidovorax sp. Root217]
MHATHRPLVFAIALVGGLFFGALFAVSLARPAWVEQTARTMIRAQIEKRTGEKIAALDARFLDGKARALLQEREREIAAVRRALTDGLPARIAAIAAEMGIPECECRKRTSERMALKLGTLQQMQTQLSDLIRTQYLETAGQLLRELRIFSGANALAFALLGIAALRKPAARLQLLPAAATLLLATAAASGVYLFGQNWLHTIVFGDYVGWALLGYIALVYAWLCDLLFNRAQVTAHLLSSAGGSVSPC